MSGQSEALANKLEAANAAVVEAVKGMSDAQWAALTKSEGWTVAATAHHIAGGHEAIGGLVQAIAGGQTPQISLAQVNEGNAQHAKDFANANRDEVIALLTKNGASAASMLRALNDAQLSTVTKPIAEFPEMPLMAIIENVLIGHVQGHGQSLQTAG